MKEFIRDDGKVRNCQSNVAKMNVLEWIWYVRELNILTDLYDSLVYFWTGVVGIILVLLTPIVYPVVGYFRIRDAKKAVSDEVI